MIALLSPSCSLADKANVVRQVEGAGFRVVVSDLAGQCRVGVVGQGAEQLVPLLSDLPGVEDVRPMAAPYPLVSRECQPESTVIKIGGVKIGTERVAVIAGPCAVESREQILSAARYVRDAGGEMLRGGAFKPRTSPYSFQGLGREGLVLLAEAREETGLPVVTEIVAAEDVDLIVEYADMLQIGARNMQNFRLLKAVGDQPRPVLLKRGLMATMEELLLAAEYIVAAGNPRVILCERGIRSYEPATRNTLDVAAIPWLKARSHLPVIVDPSHACGVRELVQPLAMAGVAAGADGIIVETHPNPPEAMSDREQALSPGDFAALMAQLAPLAAAMGRNCK
ncbi:MAG: 3-deoxy-7-phosphoheptulonate synthase [Planctomycetota bacterium]|jgi:3-deoxy-7-phosphoheptulonate synthase